MEGGPEPFPSETPLSHSTAPSPQPSHSTRTVRRARCWGGEVGPSEQWPSPDLPLGTAGLTPNRVSQPQAPRERPRGPFPGRSPTRALPGPSQDELSAGRGCTARAGTHRAPGPPDVGPSSNLQVPVRPGLGEAPSRPAPGAEQRGVEPPPSPGGATGHQRGGREPGGGTKERRREEEVMEERRGE